MVPIKKSISELFALIQAGNTGAFDELFLNYYPRLSIFARQYVKDNEAAREVASGVFVKLWLTRATLNQINKPEVYLYIAVKNAALNYLRPLKNKPSFIADEPAFAEPTQDTNPHPNELHLILQQAIAALPPQRQIIFKMIKEDGLKSRDVAEILDLSPRTVESQLYKAVKFLADELTVYLGYNPQQTKKRKPLLLNLFMYCW